MASATIGLLTQRAIDLLGLKLNAGERIYIGQSNINHMKSRHPQDFSKYGKYITDIITSPDYVGHNVKDNSIEYVKEFKVDGEYIKIAVRASGKGALYARSIYALNPNRVQNFINKGTLLKY